MSPILKILEDLAKKLGIAPAVLFIPFSIVAPFEVSAVQLFTKGALQDFLMFTPVMALTLYFAFYFVSAKTAALKKISLHDDNEKNIILRSTLYSILCFFISGVAVAVLINQKNVQADKALYHTTNNKGIVIANMDYVQLTEKNLDEKTLSNILNKGFIDPLNETLKTSYSTDNLPTIKLLPTYLPTDLKTNFNMVFKGVKTNYTAWAKERNYDIVIYGEAQQGESDKILLNLDFDIFDEPKTVQTDQTVFKLNYTVSNYDNDALFASFDNMAKEIGGITLYLDAKYTDAKTLFTEVIASLERETKDFAEDKAVSESERKSFAQKRKRIQQNIGVVYFYLGNTLLLAEDVNSAKTAYKKSEELLKINITADNTINSWAEFIKYMFTTYAAENSSSLEMAVINNLSVIYAKTGDFAQAEEVLVNLDAAQINNPILKQNLGVVYLEKGIDEIKKQNTEITETDLNAQIAKLGAQNPNIQKAVKILNQVSLELENNNKTQDSQILRNNYHNQGVINLIQADFNKAEDFFSKELALQNKKQPETLNSISNENPGTMGIEKEFTQDLNQLLEMVEKTEKLKEMHNESPDKAFEEMRIWQKEMIQKEKENLEQKGENKQFLEDLPIQEKPKDLPIEMEKLNNLNPDGTPRLSDPLAPNLNGEKILEPMDRKLPVEKQPIENNLPPKIINNLSPVKNVLPLEKEPIEKLPVENIAPKEPVMEDPRKIELREKILEEQRLREEAERIEAIKPPVTEPAPLTEPTSIKTIPTEPVVKPPFTEPVPVKPPVTEPTPSEPIPPPPTNPPTTGTEPSALDKVREQFRQEQLERMGKTTIE